jgi:hypothetical protein
MISNEPVEAYKAGALIPGAKVAIKLSSLLPGRAIRILIAEVFTIASGGLVG